jgi:hypothetical protein
LGSKRSRMEGIMALQPNLLAVNTSPPVFATRGKTPEPTAVQEQTPAAPVKPIVDGFFISPLLQFDNQALALIFQVRDSESGEVQRQFPRESVIESLRSNPEIRTIQIPDDSAETSAPATTEPVVGSGGADATETSGGAETETVAVVGGTAVANGAPAIGGTSSGISPALGPSGGPSGGSGGQGVDFLV